MVIIVINASWSFLGMYWIPSNSWQLEAFSSPNATNAFSMQDLLLSTIGNWLLLQLEIYKLQESFHKVTTILRKSFQGEPLHQLTSLSGYHPPSLTFQVIVLSLGFLESSQSSQSVFGNRIYRTVAGWTRRIGFLQMPVIIEFDLLTIPCCAPVA